MVIWPGGKPRFGEILLDIYTKPSCQFIKLELKACLMNAIEGGTFNSFEVGI